MITDFIFDGQNLSSFGYIICDFNSSSGIETHTVSDMSFTDIKSPLSNISHVVATSYADNLNRTIQIMKNTCDNDSIDVTNDDLSKLSRWLCRKEYKLFKWVDDKDDDEIFYEVQIQLKKIELASGRVGIELNITANAPYGFTRELTINKSIGSSFFSSQEEYEAYEGESYPPMVESFFPPADTTYANQYKLAYRLVYNSTQNRTGYVTLSSDTEVVLYLNSSNLAEIMCLSDIKRDDIEYIYVTTTAKKSTYDIVQPYTIKATSYSDVIEHHYGTKAIKLYDELSYKNMKLFDSFESAENYFATGSLTGLVSMPDSTESSFKVNVFSDEEGYIYPDVVINVKADGDLELVNEYENRTTYIADCKVGETITFIGGDTLQVISSDDTHDMSSCFNYKFPRLCSEYRNYTNKFSTNLACGITMKYKGIRKVGI